MGTSRSSGVTNLLLAWTAGDDQALPKLMEEVYHDLHRAAHRHMAGERSSHTLQTTALIHEVFLRLVDSRRLRFQNRAHFLAVCARLMRQILIDFARKRKGQKRGAGQLHLSLEEAPEVSAKSGQDLLAIDEALTQLSLKDARKAKVVELRFFGGLTEEETASALNLSVVTVRRDWKFARAWLGKQLGGGNDRGH
jgi:RNA polymerase sigma factor (TIGR02999 family)